MLLSYFDAAFRKALTSANIGTICVNMRFVFGAVLHVPRKWVDICRFMGPRGLLPKHRWQDYLKTAVAAFVQARTRN